MAATEQFQSKYRRDNPRTSASGTRERRKVFEADGSERGEPKPASTGVSVRSYGRDRLTDRTDSAVSASVNSRFRKMNIADDKDGSDKEETPKRNDDDDDEPKKSAKKERGGASANSARKRQARKNLREKRRSTGVVIMPGQPNVAADDEEKAVQENTEMNMEATRTGNSSAGTNNADHAELLKQVQSYEQSIEEWKDELAKAKREIEALRNDNQRLKDENSALLRVVGSLSGTGRKC